MISLLLISIILVVTFSYFLKINNINTFLLMMGILLLLKLYLEYNDGNNVLNTFNKHINNQPNENSNDKNTQSDNMWTDDRIIPLNKYNQKDCTNDGSCIIPPDKYNLYPTVKNAPKVNTRLNLKYQHSNVETKNCLICLKNIDPLKNPITEHFSNENPYGHFTNKIKMENLPNTVKKILNNIENNNSNNDINLVNIKQLSDKICHHCKIGLCVNDGCISV